MILLVDNYDSFVHNLARYFVRLGQPTHVVRNSAIDEFGVEKLTPGALVLSPGPCTPTQAGCSIALVRHFAGKLPILGVCLGHQAIADAFGGRIVRAKAPVHGQVSRVYHDGRGVFFGIPNPMTGCRYHSLVVEESTLPECLEVSAHTDDGTVMAIRHRRLPIIGLQFHPESILTEAGFLLLANFLELAGLAVSPVVPGMESERPIKPRPVLQLPSTPVPY